MVKAEITYNPYLLETSIKFNGNRPKINSMVEKYISGKLQNWILMLPYIFYGEMNGWDFAIDFSGTKTDFESLKNAFDKANKGKGSVFLFHKNELGSVEQKKQRITDLLAWFEANPNGRFDYSSFKEANTVLFDDKCSLIVVQGMLANSIAENVIIENVNDVNELEHVKLENIPIIFFVNENKRRQFKENLKAIIMRNDVIPEQIFFHVDSEQRHLQLQRIIEELALSNPQVVNDSISQSLAKYFEVYPMTAYIQRIIKVFRVVESNLSNLLKSEAVQNISINSEVRQQINSHDVIIHKLKTAAEQIYGRDNFDKSGIFNSAKNEFSAKITGWPKKRIKITSDGEAGAKAVEFQNELGDYFGEFIRTIKKEFYGISSDLRRNFADIYAFVKYGDDYIFSKEAYIDLSLFRFPTIIEKLLELKEERMVEQSQDLLGSFRSLLSAAKHAEPKEYKREVEYKYDVWRKHALQVSSPIAEEIIHYAACTLTDYYNTVAENYLEHLKMLIEQQTLTKDKLATQLSADERKFQADIDWFDVFQEKLREIERG